ncbi:MAG: glycosyltransferase [candidate division NC10 bacterium]|nr:glycosyltransferase [candidate division NC10 bacterium]
MGHKVGSEKVKIAYVIGTLDLGGAERQLVALAKGLDRSRFLPVIFCLTATGPLITDLAEAGVKTRCFGLRGLKVWRNPLRVARALLTFFADLKKEKPEIVHGLLFHAYILGTFAAKIAGVPIVIASRRSLGRFKERKWHYLVAERLANRMTDLIIANAEAVKEDVIHQEKVKLSKVRVMYNGIDPSLYDLPPDPTLRASLGIPEAARVVGIVANLIHYKGHRFFLHACQAIKRKSPEVMFLLIGDGPCREVLEDLARELGLEKDVLFLGSRQDVPHLLALMDVVVLPSLEEGFPNAVLEAMAAGKPVVATEVGGVPEVIVHRKTGLLVPPKDPQALADAIIELLDDPQLALEMGRAGRERVTKEFGLDRMIREMEGLYEELIARKLQGKGRP